jgi:hypothetical protein
MVLLPVVTRAKCTNVFTWMIPCVFLFTIVDTVSPANLWLLQSEFCFGSWAATTLKTLLLVVVWSLGVPPDHRSFPVVFNQTGPLRCPPTMGWYVHRSHFA